MENPLKSAADLHRELMFRASDATTNLGLKIAGWLLIGNAGALGLAFNARLDGKVCSGPLLDFVNASFAAGLGAAFAGLLASYGLLLASTKVAAEGMQHLAEVGTKEYYAADLEQNKVPVPSELEVDYEALQAANKARERRMARIRFFSSASLVFYAVSMLGFGLGVAKPVFDRAASLTCPEKPTT